MTYLIPNSQHTFIQTVLPNDDNGYANCMIFGRFHNNIINLKMLHVCRIQRKSLYDYRSNRKNGIKSSIAKL